MAESVAGQLRVNRAGRNALASCKLHALYRTVTMCRYDRYNVPVLVRLEL